MPQTQLRRLLPTMRMISEALEARGFRPELVYAPEDREYRGVRLYSGQTQLEPDVLYLLSEEWLQRFPTDSYAYISTVPLAGKQEHICCSPKGAPEILDVLLDIFLEFQDWESQLNQLVFRQGSLDELCDLGESITGNPFCIHDDWFAVIAASAGVGRIMQMDYSALSPKGAIPRSIVDTFKFDSDYMQTYDHNRAQLWSSVPGSDSSRCLYMNLWDGDWYRGRLLCLEGNQRIRAAHYPVAECIAQRALLLLQQSRQTQALPYRSTDNVLLALLEGNDAEAMEVNALMVTLGWNRMDRYICILLEPQNPQSSVMNHVLHGDLFRQFPQGYLLLLGQQQCLILNLSRMKTGEHNLSHLIAPFCLDYGLYAGISSPVYGCADLQYAFRQAKIALEHAFTLRNDQWIITFSSCALEYTVRNIHTDLPQGQLIAPELFALLEHDRQKDTEYFDTLKTYLLMERDIPRTSQALIIHRTTLLYRLKRIRELTHANLDDPNLRLYWLLSLYLLEKGEK